MSCLKLIQNYSIYLFTSSGTKLVCKTHSQNINLEKLDHQPKNYWMDYSHRIKTESKN